MQCRKCGQKARRKVTRPDLNILRIEVKEMGFSSVGRKYGVSDNAIRKWLKCYNRASDGNWQTSNT